MDSALYPLLLPLGLLAGMLTTVAGLGGGVLLVQEAERQLRQRIDGDHGQTQVAPERAGDAGPDDGCQAHRGDGDVGDLARLVLAGDVFDREGQRAAVSWRPHGARAEIRSSSTAPV